MDKKQINNLTKALLWAAGLNLGVLGLFDYNVIYQVFNPWPEVLKLIYASIGASAVYSIARHKI